MDRKVTPALQHSLRVLGVVGRRGLGMQVGACIRLSMANLL